MVGSWCLEDDELVVVVVLVVLVMVGDTYLHAAPHRPALSARTCGEASEFCVVVVLLLVCSRKKTWPDSCCLVLFVCLFSKKKVIKILFAIFTSALCRREGWGKLWFYGECLVSAAGCARPPREHVWKSREVPVSPIYQNAIKIKSRQSKPHPGNNQSFCCSLRCIWSSQRKARLMKSL